MAPPQRRRSFGPVSPKRIYRSLSVKLRGGASNTEAEHSDWRRRRSKGPADYACLWDALESEDTLAVQHLLSRERERETDGRVNAVTEFGLVPLDVAALTHNASLLKVLVKAGAKHNPNLSSASDWSLKLDELVSLAEKKLEEGRAELQLKEKAELQSHEDAQKSVEVWTQRCELYHRMRENFHSTAPPGPPASAALLVTGDGCVCVRVREPCGHTHGLITRYRVEWSTSAGFSPLCGRGFISDSRNTEFSITGLQTGVQYYVRVSAYNIKGWGVYVSSSPTSVAPSSWSECIGATVRRRDQGSAVRRISQQITEPELLTENSSSVRKVSVSRGLKQLFHSSRAVRLSQRGVYLACVFYQKECVLVSCDERLPLVEVQCCSASVTQDFLWFTKLSCAWTQVSFLLQVLSSSSLSSSSSLLQNRLSFLRAVAQLQASVGCVDLGQVYFEPLKDRQGNVLLVTLREVTTPLTPSDPPLHWVPVSTLEKHQIQTPMLPEPTAVELLTERLKETLAYHRRSQHRAQPGLYVCVLKLCSSVKQLRVLVSHRLPSMPFCCRVRNRPHVTREEWAWLQRHAVGGACGSDDAVIDSSGVEDFVKELRSAVIQLLTKLNVPLERACDYRVYTQELLQAGDHVTLLLLLPPSEDLSRWPLEAEVEPHGLTLPLHIFEIVHLWAYERDLLSQFCQLWVRLELDVRLSQQALREALDSSEVTEATERLTHVTQLTQGLSALWRERRWLMDVIHTLRSKSSEGVVPLGRVMTSRPPIRSAAAAEDTPLTHTLSTVEGEAPSCSHQPEGSEVKYRVPTSPCSNGNDPEVPVTPAAEGHDLSSEIMDLFECLDLLGGSLSDLDLQDPEQALSDEDCTAPLTGRPVRSLVEWVKGHHTL
ncbi:ankyrin repeat and fibronectin type-III domain-containing protein 1-like isoform X3 [Pimephales promelas]|nr:ankyrin repeat and fibronectin type-III domain-containing protein 1-like isoform X3 [Pimephales promelas]KAG1928862.1 ankyrin repeat and fibronectin type-III domain-containing protein [Pimephales promelas]KAG1928863.1 ankyrin repeat and fibronectin type-III domain-containing protein [Pimephales promelas]